MPVLFSMMYVHLILQTPVARSIVLVSLRKHQENSQVLNELLLPLSPFGHMKIQEIYPNGIKRKPVVFGGDLP